MLIVLDINGTLIDTSIVVKGEPDYKFRYKYIYSRPYLQTFLRWLLNDSGHEVGVWSSGIKKNTDGIVNLIFGQQKRKLKFVLSRENCIVKEDHATIKPVQKIIDFGYNPESILFIDDTSSKIDHYNHYLIPQYLKNENDRELAKLFNYLNF